MNKLKRNQMTKLIIMLVSVLLITIATVVFLLNDQISETDRMLGCAILLALFFCTATSIAPGVMMFFTSLLEDSPQKEEDLSRKSKK